MNRQERRAAARKSRSNPDSSAAPTPAALYASGLAHLRSSRLMDAQVCCQQALAIDPVHADSFFLMGLLAVEAGNYDHAVSWFARAIGEAVKSEYLFALGTALQRLRRFDEASKAFDKAVQLNPDNPEMWRNLARALSEAERTDIALLAYLHVLKLNPRDNDAEHQSGILLLNLGRMEEALIHFTRSNELSPDQALTLELRGHALHNLKRFEEALADHQRVYALNPGNPNASNGNNIGASLQSLRRYEEALVWFDLAIALQPDFVKAYLNKGLCLAQLGRFDEAIAAFSQGKTIDPDDADIEWNLSLLQLMTGNFEAGWAGREARWRGRMRPSYPKFSQAMWLGDADIEGKTVLIQEDEGLGDTLQFARYIPLLAARGARVILVVRDQMYPVLSGLPGVSRCIPQKSAGSLPPFDLHCPVCSLPRAFGTRLDTIPSDVPYLPAPSGDLVRTWKDRLGEQTGGHEKLRVGLVWSGNPQHDNDHNRSIPLQALLRIADTDATFVSLQKELRAGDDALLAQSGIVDVTSHLTDFAETAALLSCLDLVITVDTSVAHLAGASGRPTWVLLPFVPDYRWLLDREDSPWYPTLRLFRQSERRDWKPVLDRVRNELAERISARP
jgi:tetratricopeptide (TPR) repeat protein